MLFVFYGCTYATKESNVSFKTIDISVFNGWTFTCSYKVFDNGQIHIEVEEHRRPNIYYNLLLPAEELDSISRIVDKIISLPMDTVYYGNCVDCGYYNLIIKTEDAVFRSFVEGIHNKDAEAMHELVDFLYGLIDDYESNHNYSIYEKFQFESKNEIFPIEY